MNSRELILFNKPQELMMMRPPASRRYYYLKLASGSFLFVALFLQLALRISSIGISYGIEHVRELALANDNKLRHLEYEYTTATRPAVVRSRAVETLGMVQAQRSMLRRIEVRGSRSDKKPEDREVAQLSESARTKKQPHGA